MQDSKPLWQSKTFWLNSLTTLAGILLVLSENETVKEHPQIVGWIVTGIGVVNVVLRIITDRAVSLMSPWKFPPSVMLLCLLVASCGAAELKLPASPVEPHTLIRMQVIDAAAVDDVMVMTARGSEVFFVDVEPSATAGVYVFTGPPGVYSIRVKVRDTAPLIGRVEVGGVPFPPTPPVPPEPPTPPVTAGKRGLIVLYESGSNTTADERLYRALQSSGSFQDYCKSKGHMLWVLDDDLPQAASWLGKVADRPGLIVFDRETLSVLWTGKRPATADDILALLKQHGG